MTPRLLSVSLALFAPFTLSSMIGASPQVAAAPDPATEAPWTWIDLDRDGRLEGLRSRSDGALQAVGLDADGRLVDRTAELGLAALQPASRAYVDDLDGDGAPDLLVLTRTGGVQVLRNEGTSFLDLTAGSGLEAVTDARAATAPDLDGDARRELVLTTTRGLELYHAVDAFRFEPAGATLAAPALVPAAPVVVAAEDEQPGEPAAARGSGDDTPRAAPRTTDGRTPLGVAPATPDEGTTGDPDVFRFAPPTPSIGNKLPAQICADSITDQANGQCIDASSIPAIGSLYPLSSDLFVDAATGHVGLGTTTPANGRLSILTNGVAGIFASSGSVGPSTAIFSSPNTSSGAPTVLAYAGQGGTSGFFQEKLSVGGTLFGIPLPRATLGIDFLENAELTMRNGSSIETVELVTEEGSGNGAQLELRMHDGTTTFSLDAEVGSLASELSMFNRSGTETVELKSSEAAGNGAQLVLRKDNGVATMVLDAETSVAAEFSLRNSSGSETIEFLSEEIAGDGAQIVLRKFDGTPSIVLDAEQGVNGRITTDTLEITGGADLVESFQTRADYAPGTVLCIDPERPGELTRSTSAYDARVAGVVSGAGGVRPGLHLGQRGMLEGDTPVALTGRVFVRCTSEGGAIAPGDLLTTSSTAGTAMRAADVARRPGAVIGKAMTALDGDCGLVLVLVSLQ